MLLLDGTERARDVRARRGGTGSPRTGTRQLAAWAVALLLALVSTQANAAQQIFDVDELQSTFTAGSITVNFDVVAHSTGIFGSQPTTGSATVVNPGYAADGTVTIDTQAGQVTLEGLEIGGPVGQSDTVQSLIRVTRTEAGFEYDELLPVRFVPLIEGLGAD